MLAQVVVGGDHVFLQAGLLRSTGRTIPDRDNGSAARGTNARLVMGAPVCDLADASLPEDNPRAQQAVYRPISELRKAL
jgi:hypothetical protein